MKTDKPEYKLLCQHWQRGMDFVPIVFTASGGMGGSSSDSTGIHTGLLRVAEEDEAMKIGPWVATDLPERGRQILFLGSQIHGRGCKL